MRKQNVASIGDLLHFAVSLGYYWNQAIDILREDGVGNFDDGRNETWERADFIPASEREEYDEVRSDDTVKIMQGFMDKHDVEYFVLTR